MSQPQEYSRFVAPATILSESEENGFSYYIVDNPAYVFGKKLLETVGKTQFLKQASPSMVDITLGGKNTTVKLRKDKVYVEDGMVVAGDAKNATIASKFLHDFSSEIETLVKKAKRSEKAKASAAQKNAEKKKLQEAENLQKLLVIENEQACKPGYVRLNPPLKIVFSTVKAHLCTKDNTEIWLPKSVVYENGGYVFQVMGDMALSKSLAITPESLDAYNAYVRAEKEQKREQKRRDWIAKRERTTQEDKNAYVLLPEGPFPAFYSAGQEVVVGNEKILLGKFIRRKKIEDDDQFSFPYGGEFILGHEGEYGNIFTYTVVK